MSRQRVGSLQPLTGARRGRLVPSLWCHSGSTYVHSDTTRPLVAFSVEMGRKHELPVKECWLNRLMFIAVNGVQSGHPGHIGRD